MFNFIKKRQSKTENLLKESILLSQELEWANVFHDSIKGKPWLANLSINIGRWAGNYSFFYLLHRILQDYKPSSILEFGLGESSKFISTYLSNTLPNTKHVVIEHDTVWEAKFNENFSLATNSSIINCALLQTQVNGFTTNCYEKLQNKITTPFDFYIVDGPFGSDRFSRYDMYYIAEKFTTKDEFIILFDDTHRKGEEDSVNAIATMLASKGIEVFVQSYEGVKKNTIIATKKYKFVTSL
jgi:hypothetical protein